MYQTKNPILLIFYNRKENLKKVFNQIKLVKPKKLYLLSDGWKNEEEKELVLSIRAWVLNNITWDCQVIKKFHEKNLGCGKNVSRGLEWFFNQENQGIILEDDCYATISFFQFCDLMLEKYKDNKKIYHIGGTNFIPNINIKESYYFSKIMHCWGWASWKDRFQKYNFNVDFFKNNDFKKISKNKNVQKYWIDIHKKMLLHKIDTWDYQWTLSIIKNNGLCIYPKKNLVSNIGDVGSHFVSDSPLLNLKAYEIDFSKENFIHHKKIKLDIKHIENYFFKNVFNIELNNDYFKKLLKTINLLFLLTK